MIDKPIPNQVSHVVAHVRQDAGATDAFGRSRVSNTGQRLDCEFIYNKQDDLFDEQTNNGTVTHNANTRDLTLSLSDANNGSYAHMSSYPVPYTPGNSQLIDITGVLDFAGIGGGTAEVFLRSKISGTVTDISTIDQPNWYTRKTGVDWTKSHIFSIDFQSLKVGRIRFFMVANGAPVEVASIENDNVRDSGYWQLANLPAYWKLYTTGGETIMECGYGNDDNAIGFRYVISANASATMKAICCTVKSEGGYDLNELPGFPRSVDNNITAISVGTTLVPILSIRAKSTFQTFDNLNLVIPKFFSISTDNPIKVVVLHDATLTGASWTDVDATESCVEYDVSATAVTNGHEVFSDYVNTTAKNSGNNLQGLLGKTLLWNRLDASKTGTLTIAAVRTTTTSADCLSSFQWEEIR